MTDDGQGPPMRYIRVPAGRRTVPSASKEAAILERINQKVAASDSIEEIVDFLFDHTRDLFPCDRIGLALLEDEGRRVFSRYVRSDYAPLQLREGYSEDLAGSSLETVIRAGRPRIIRDLEAYLAEHPESRSSKLLVGEGVRSSLTCPLVVEGRRVGLLFRSSREVGAYGDGEVSRHLAVAERLSQAVEKAWRIQQLAQLNRSYTQMLRFVSHELRSPVSSMIMEAELILDGYLGEVDDRQQEKLGNMVRKGHYLLNLIGDYLDLSRIEGGRLQVAPEPEVDLGGEVLDETIELIQPQADAKDMSIVRDVADGVGGVECDPHLIKTVLVNLLSNAVKYGREGGEIRVDLARRDGEFNCSVRNEGPGFEPGQRDQLFRKFSRLDSPELMKQKGSGVGLYTVWHIINRHGGKVEAHSEPGQWARFGFRLPQPLPTELPGGEAEDD